MARTIFQQNVIRSKNGLDFKYGLQHNKAESRKVAHFFSCFKNYRNRSNCSNVKRLRKFPMSMTFAHG